MHPLRHTICDQGRARQSRYENRKRAGQRGQEEACICCVSPHRSRRAERVHGNQAGSKESELDKPLGIGDRTENVACGGCEEERQEYDAVPEIATERPSRICYAEGIDEHRAGVIERRGKRYVQCSAERCDDSRNKVQIA